MNEISKKTEKSMLTRTITAIVLVVVLGPAVTFGGWYMLVASLLMVFFATYEILALPGKNHYSKFVWIWTYIAMYSIVYWPFLKSTATRTELLQGNFFSLYEIFISVSAIVIYLIGLFCFSFMQEAFRMDDIFYLFTMVVLVALGFYSILFIRYYPTAFLEKNRPSDVTLGSNWNLGSSLFFWYTFSGVAMSDIGAYFTGVLFGKHPMNPRVSPHKTWEGFAGGFVASLILTISIACIFQFCFGIPLIGSTAEGGDPNEGLSFYSQNGYGWCYILLLSFAIPILDNVGGFIFSSIKRHFGVKDWGFILPGHGGIIDRLDSTFVTSTVVAILITFITNGWQFIGK